MKDRKHTDPYEQCVTCALERGAERIEALGSKPDHWNLDADMRERLDAAFASLDRVTTPEKLSGAKLAEPGAGSFDYGKAMRDGHEAMKRQVQAVRLHDRGGYLSPPCSVGDTVRWWPDGHNDGQALVDRYIDGTVTAMRPLCIKVTGSHGFTERVMGGWRMPAHSGVVDTSVSPGTVQRLNALDFVIDGRTLRWCLAIDESSRRTENHGFALSPAQRAAVSAHWSAELRAKVAARAVEDKAGAPSVMVDHED